MIAIRPLRGSTEVRHAKMLLARMREDLAYGKWLFHTAIGREAARMPRRYRQPGAEFFLAWADGEPAGCLGVVFFGHGIGELKRMYVHPRFRGLGLGKKLLEAAEAFARECGYRALCLDSMKHLKPAHRLYYRRGFSRIPPYNANPPAYVLHMRKRLL